MNSNIKKILKNKLIKKIITILVSVVFIALVGIIVFNKLNVKEAKADTTFLNTLLKKSSELTTAELYITGMSEYTDTGIKILNRSDFVMVYKANVRAGIDVSKVKVKSDDTNKKIYVEIPKAEIQDAKVDPATIKYFDEKISLFNTNEKEDANKAQELAEKEAKKEAVNTGILTLADKQSEELVKGIIANAIPDGYTIKVIKQK